MRHKDGCSYKGRGGGKSNFSRLTDILQALPSLLPIPMSIPPILLPMPDDEVAELMAGIVEEAMLISMLGSGCV